MMAIAYVIARRRDYPRRTAPLPWREVRERTERALPALIAPVIIIGGILGGVVTPTEAGALGVLYAILVGFLVTKELTWSHFPAALLRSGLTTATVFILIATANVVAWLLTVAKVPHLLSAGIRGVSDSPWVFLLIVNLLLLAAGCFLDNLAIMIMFTPILAPIAASFGVDPVHFGFIFVMNGVVGMLTPPFGILLFVVCGIARVPLVTLARAVVPFVAWQVVVLLLCTYVPELVLWVPRIFGFVR
jgi:tripartite ATP-independent transporter DctM subunit